MRGKGVFVLHVQLAQGITPAYAGKRMPSVLSDFKHRDHPRLCGEKHFDTLFRFFVTGSPPPMRGKGKM